MSDHGNEAVNRARDEAAAQGRALGLETGWIVFSYLLAGMAAYGAIGWLVGRAVHVALLFPLGMLLGLGISIGYIIYRFGRGGMGGTISPHDRGDLGGSSPRARKGDYR